MDISDYTRIILDRIQKFEPENATKIIGYLLLQDLGEPGLAKLATCPDHMMREIVFKSKTELQNLAAKSAIVSSPPPINPQPGITHLPIISPRTTNPSSFPAHAPNFWEPQLANSVSPDFMSMGYIDSIPELQKQAQLLCAEKHIDPSNVGAAGIANDYFGFDALNVNLNAKPGRRFGMSEFPVKACHYFIKGYCKHGSSCRYYHGQVAPESFSQMNGNGDDQGGLSSLAQLEAELVELLKPRRGNPISIASIPMAYYEKYKKVLQAEGYLTESQRHGKSGYSLTKLLARLKNSIRIIDRPHGQHAVVLVEDRYLEKGESSQNTSASKQIYMTFPADSSFTEQDVSDYFNAFGVVEDVRIPSQEERMYGFVTFDDPETAKMILEKGNPHLVRGSRVLVKPYREKSKLMERKHSERVESQRVEPLRVEPQRLEPLRVDPQRGEPPVVSSPHHVDMDFDPTPTPRPIYGNPRFLRRQHMDEQEKVHEFQRRRPAELQLTPKPLSSSPQFGFSLDQLNVSEDHLNFQPVQILKYALNLSDKTGHADTSCGDEDRGQGIDLPDSPFSFPVDSGISTVI